MGHDANLAPVKLEREQLAFMDSVFQSSATSIGGETTANIAQLERLERLRVPQDLLTSFCASLPEVLEGCPQPTKVLGRVVDFIDAARSPLSTMALFDREPESLQTLGQLFALGDFFYDQLLFDPDAFELLRLTRGAPVSCDVLRDEITSELSACEDLPTAAEILANFRIRESLRIAFGELIGGGSALSSAQQLTDLCEVILSAALQTATKVATKNGVSIHPVSAQGDPQEDGSNHPQVRFAVVALGALGGREMDYTSQINLLLVRHDDIRQTTDAGGLDKIAEAFLQVLRQETSCGRTYEVELQQIPREPASKVLFSLDKSASLLDARGRTWQRQAFTKARVVAGDDTAGQKFLSGIQDWVHRRFLMRADESGLAAMKRRVLAALRASPANDHTLCLDCYRQSFQFLQLVYGAKHPKLRLQNTLEMLGALESVGIVDSDDSKTLQEALVLHLACHHATSIASSEEDQEETVGEAVGTGATSRQARNLTESLKYVGNRTPDKAAALPGLHDRCVDLINELVESAFEDSSEATPEGDLLLNPAPNRHTVSDLLGKYGFEDVHAAWRHLESLSHESVSFLSTRRCRHFLTTIVAELLERIAATPSPDNTLVQLARVSDSIGCKGVLWELFASAPAAMDLAIRLCAASPYLTNLLTSSPGLVDELLDSLMLTKLPTREEMAAELDELCREAEDIAPLVRNFKNAMHLRVGARNVVRKDSVATIHGALSDIAEVCVQRVIRHEFHRLVNLLGMPSSQGPSGETVDAEMVVLAIGKLGGREPNYHSDVDLLFLFDSDGQTRTLIPSHRFRPTSNRHFFNQLAQRVVSAITNYVEGGRLYDVDVSLRPLGQAGQLAITIEELRNHFRDQSGEIWRRMTLCKARVIWGSQAATLKAEQCVEEILLGGRIDFSAAEHIQSQRFELERDAGVWNLKRSPGGTMDIEFVTQMLQIHAARQDCLIPSTTESLHRLENAGTLDSESATELRQNYSFLRRLESALRLLNTSARHSIPSKRSAQEVLAYLVGDVWSEPSEDRSHSEPDDCRGHTLPSGDDDPVEHLLKTCRRVMKENRRIFAVQMARFLPADLEESAEDTVDGTIG